MGIVLMEARMYSELVSVLILIFGGTFVFSRYSGEQRWLAPFVLLSSGVLLAVFARHKHLRRIHAGKKTDDAAPETFDALLAGAIWVGWMTYGLVFKDMHPLFDGVAAYIHGSLAVVLVLMSHSVSNVQQNVACADILAFLVIILLFMPHPDMISFDLEPLMLYTKVSVFAVLFCVSEVAQKMGFDTRISTKNPPTEADRMYATQIQVVQTAWVLLSIFPLLLLATLQILMFAGEIRMHTQREHQDANQPILPTTVPPADPGGAAAAATIADVAVIPVLQSSAQHPQHLREAPSGGRQASRQTAQRAFRPTHFMARRGMSEQQVHAAVSDSLFVRLPTWRG